MKLNPDCVRDVLLTVEESCDFKKILCYAKDSPMADRLEKYTHDEIIYHMMQCNLSGLITDFHSSDNGGLITIGDLSPNGHKFLANIRKDTIWNNTKSIASQIGSKSLDALVQIASNVITELIKAQFGLT